MVNFKPDIKEQTIYVPYSEEVLASVWSVDRGLQMFTNVPEDLAKMNAQEYFDTHIYFFAELTTETDKEVYLRYLKEKLNKDGLDDHVTHRDAETGQFVTEEYTEEHPDTTVTEHD